MARTQRKKRSGGRVLIGIAVFGFILINGLAAMHAYWFTHFTEPGPAEVFNPEMGWGAKLRIAATGKRMPRPVNAMTPADAGLAFETLRFGSEEGIELEAWYIAAGEDAPLVIVFNSYANAKGLLVREAQAFRELGAAVLMVDLRGGGGSTGDGTTVGYREAADVAATVAYAAEHFPAPRTYIYGPSMGGAAALRAAAEHSLAVDGIIAESVFAQMLDTVRARFRMLKAPTVVLPELLVFWGGALNGYWAFEHNPAEYCAATDVPVLVLGGSEDDRVPAAETERLADACANLAGVEIFQGAGHIHLVAADGPRWQRVVGEFIR